MVKTDDSEGEDSAEEENFEVERIVDYKRVSYEMMPVNRLTC